MAHANNKSHTTYPYQHRTTIDAAQANSRRGGPYTTAKQLRSELQQGRRPRLKAPSIRPAPGAPLVPAGADGGGGGGGGNPLGAYTQRALFPSTPGATQNPLLDLSHARYGLPPRLVANLAALGIASIYPWQSSCLLGAGMLAGTQNLVYTAPTGGGKSLVADVLVFRRVLERRKALLVLPYVALVQEKLRWLQRAVDGVEVVLPTELAEDGLHPSPPPDQVLPEWKRAWQRKGIRVAGFFGGSQTRDAWADIDVAVCTIEKANSMVNAAVAEKKVGEMGIVVLDELHFIDDQHRGYLLELMTTKLLVENAGVQIVGMSATLKNSRQLAGWVGGKFYDSKYKPVPIEEFLVCEDLIYKVPDEITAPTRDDESRNLLSAGDITKSAPLRIIDHSEDPKLASGLANAVLALAIETVMANYGALVFCNSRVMCESTARRIAEAMPTPAEVGKEAMTKRNEVITSLKSIALLPLDEKLAELILDGVAFHHAGLTTNERDVVADAYDKGIIKVVVATCSLAAGINLPARRVIIQGARMGREIVAPAMLRQMRGRAGRKGKDEIGESYVCCNQRDLHEVESLILTDLPPVSSSLVPEKRGVKRALLEVIGVVLAQSQEALQEYMRSTLLHAIMPASDLENLITDAIEYLEENKLIEFDEQQEIWSCTTLGHAIVAAGLPPEDGLTMYTELQKALESFVMDGEMHVFYIFTPYSPSSLGMINWEVFLDMMDPSIIDKSGQRVMSLVGVNPAVVARMNQTGDPNQQLQDLKAEEQARMLPYYRFYAALQISQLCNEMPIPEVANKFNTSRGYLQALHQASQTTAGSAIMFCKRMGWGMLAAVLEHMRDRLLAGARADLLELARIPFVKSRTARSLWEQGFRSLRDVAEATKEDVAQALIMAQPNKRDTLGENEDAFRERMMERAEIMMSWAGRTWERERLDAMEIDM